MVNSNVPATVVLVHGAWHGAWCWHYVVDLLAARGVRCVAIDLPGRGDDPNRQGDLHADTAAVCHVLDELDGPAVLVGHSYGGAVVTEAGVHPMVAHVVYIAGLALDHGETCSTAAAAEAAAAGLSHDGRPDLGSGLYDAGDGMVLLDESVAAACLYQDCDEDDVRWAVARLGSQRLLSLQQSPRAVAWRQRPSTYVVCAHDLAVHPGLQRILAARCTSGTEWQCGHSPFLSQPDLVADMLSRMVHAAHGDKSLGSGK